MGLYVGVGMNEEQRRNRNYYRAWAVLLAVNIAGLVGSVILCIIFMPPSYVYAWLIVLVWNVVQSAVWTNYYWKAYKGRF